MTLEELMGHSADELEAMSDQELKEKFADVFKLEPKAKPLAVFDSESNVVKTPKIKTPKTKKEKLAAALEELKRLDEAFKL